MLCIIHSRFERNEENRSLCRYNVYNTIQRVLETPRIKELLSRFPPFNLDLTLPRELTPEARNGVHLVAIALNADKRILNLLLVDRSPF